MVRDPKRGFRGTRSPRAGASALGGMVVLALATVAPVAAQTTPGGGATEANASGSPELEALGALAVGTWEASGSRHVLEWGVGRRLIRSRSYFADGDDWTLTSEGMWYWDSEAGSIRGIVLAVGMPVERFEYTTRVEGSEVIHDLEAFGAMAGEFVETWAFEGDRYRWTLERPADDGRERMMGGEYEKAESGGG